MTISIGIKKTGWVTSKLVNQLEVADRMEKTLASAMSKYDYKYERGVEVNVGGLSAFGVSYNYTAKDIPMSARSLVLKQGSTFFYFHLYTRTALKDENMAVMTGILESIEWV